MRRVGLDDAGVGVDDEIHRGLGDAKQYVVHRRGARASADDLRQQLRHSAKIAHATLADNVLELLRLAVLVRLVARQHVVHVLEQLLQELDLVGLGALVPLGTEAGKVVAEQLDHRLRVLAHRILDRQRRIIDRHLFCRLNMSERDRMCVSTTICMDLAPPLLLLL